MVNELYTHFILQCYETHTMLCNGMKCIPVLILKSLRHSFSQTNNFSQIYCNDPKFSDRQVWGNSVDPDQTARGSTLFAVPFALFGCIILIYGKATFFKF